MKWIEMVRVRSSAGTLEGSMPQLTEQMAEIVKTPGAQEAFVMKHALYDGDLAAVVVWENDRHPVKTREGLLLAEQLQRLGTVDHAVWTAAAAFEATPDANAPRAAAGGSHRCL